MSRLLVIDDDRELVALVTEFLASEGFEVAAVHDGAAGVERTLSGEFALVVLDVMLPRINGFEVLRRIRTSHAPHARVPVLMLTARGEASDRILGLQAGADDYLPKPFEPLELLARIQAVLRRTLPGEAAPNGWHGLVAVGDVELDAGARAVRRAGRPVELTAVEFDLLEALLRAAGRVVKREELTRLVLNRELSPFDRSIDVHVSKLRRKLGDGTGAAGRIKTVRGVGYIYTRSQESGVWSLESKSK